MLMDDSTATEIRDLKTTVCALQLARQMDSDVVELVKADDARLRECVKMYMAKCRCHGVASTNDDDCCAVCVGAKAALAQGGEHSSDQPTIAETFEAVRAAGGEWSDQDIKDATEGQIVEKLTSRLLAVMRAEECACAEATCDSCIVKFIEAGQFAQADIGLSLLEQVVAEGGSDEP